MMKEGQIIWDGDRNDVPEDLENFYMSKFEDEDMEADDE